MAKLFLENKFSAPAEIYYNTECGHYSFANGQHRTCVVAHLLQMGGEVTLNANIYENKYYCGYCVKQKYLYKKTPFLKKIKHIKKYIKLNSERKSFENSEHLVHFD